MTQWTWPHACRLNGPLEPTEDLSQDLAEDPLRGSGGAAQPTP